MVKKTSLNLHAKCVSFKCGSFLGVNSDWLDLVLNKSSTAVSSKYNGILIERLQNIIHISSQPSKYIFITFLLFFI